MMNKIISRRYIMPDKKITTSKFSEAFYKTNVCAITNNNIDLNDAYKK